MLESLRPIREMPRAVILAVLALAVLARLAVPAGWMPVADANGPRLTICTGMGPLDGPDRAGSMPDMAAHHAPGDHKQDYGNHVCPFAAAAVALAEPVLPTLDMPPVAAHERPPLRNLAVAVGRGLAAPPPPATGPPSLV